MTALWGSVLLPDGAVLHVRIPVAVVPVTAAQAFLGLGA
jgi:hypothetical protein